MSRVEPPDLPPDVLSRALGGDGSAFNRLYRRYDPTVRWAVGLRVYRWPELAPSVDDVVQEVWLELTRRGCKRLRYHDIQRGVPFWRFVVVISSRLAWRIAKRQLGHSEVSLADALDHDDWAFVMRMLHADFLDRFMVQVQERLDDRTWQLFEGYYVQGERLKDIGVRLGMNENAAYKRHERLQKKLQAWAQELLGEVPRGQPTDFVAVVLGTLIVLAQSGLGGCP